MSATRGHCSWATIVLVVAIAGVANGNRTFDGSANNVANPSFGAARQMFQRSTSLVTYPDSFNSIAGADRPNPRILSNAVGNQLGTSADSRGLSNLVWQWGQFLDHDITLTPESEDHGDFAPIPVLDPSDPLFSPDFPVIPFTRSRAAPGTGTPGNPRQQVNRISSFIDGSMIYGSDPIRAGELRTRVGGTLKTSAGNLLPFNLNGLENANGGPTPDDQLFLAGDIRANEQHGLIAMHTLFIREHNRQAEMIAAANPTWTDEQIYQQARRMTSGIVQSITYNEFLPALLGGLAPEIAHIAYDPTIDATISNEFATAAFRLGHTQVSGSLFRHNNDGTIATGGHRSLDDAFFDPGLITSEEIDVILKGLASVPQQETDLMLVDPLRNRLFGPPGSGGLDLFALNVQRGRDHGLATFTQLQESLGISPASSFEDITSDAQLAATLAGLYGDVSNLDQWIGLLAEDHLDGASVGPTLAAALTDEFVRLAAGDRFLFTADPFLTLSERNEIFSTTLSDVILRNTGLTNLQSNAFFAVPEPTTSVIWWTLVVALGRGRRPHRVQRWQGSRPDQCLCRAPGSSRPWR